MTCPTLKVVSYHDVPDPDQYFTPVKHMPLGCFNPGVPYLPFGLEFSLVPITYIHCTQDRVLPL